MRKILLLCCTLGSFIAFSQPITTKYEISGTKQTPTYAEAIDWWKKLDARFPQVNMLTMGPSDAGFPLHLIIVSADKDVDIASLKKKDRRFILINNGIHPGEPDGIDASMLLVRDIVMNKKTLPPNVVLAIIPVYNIGGCLNRSPYYRVDQNGPEEFGFRGNSQNLDLNRDFIKADSKEARSFMEIFHLVDPDILIDNHVSNGADYQHIMTLLSSQHSKLGGPLGEYLNKQLEPGIYTLMKQKGYDLVPYVDFAGKTPESGLVAYFDGPRYSSGYASLWGTFAFVPETHMLKSYDLRVQSTYALMESFIAYTSQHSATIKQLRAQAKQSVKTQTDFAVSWELDKSRSSEVTFKGFESGMKPSEVSGLPRLYYDRSKPYTKQLKYYNYFAARTTIKKPTAYIIPQGWWKVTELLKINKVQMKPLARDTSIEVEVYHIEDFKSMPSPYESHHMNTNVKVSTTLQKMSFRKGDWYIPMNQEANRFLAEVLEPQGDDSYFTWNFFDGILGRKEGFSDYAYEDIAAAYLKENPEQRVKLEAARAADTALAKSGNAQLNFVYRNSPNFETAFRQYPVYRVIQ